jgi:hypothetical protein
MRVALLASLVIAAGAAVAEAQRSGYSSYYTAIGPGSYGHASTVEEGAARGMADVIRSSGAANLMNSEAAINVEQARKKYIENRLLGTQTYFEMKSINKQYRDAQRKPPPTQQQAIRMSKSRVPDRLTANKLDPLTGGLAWPSVFKQETFDHNRMKLDALYAERADKGYLKSAQYVEVKQLTAEMKDNLRGFSRKIGGNASIEARKFLESLAYEAGLQAG